MSRANSILVASLLISTALALPLYGPHTISTLGKRQQRTIRSTNYSGVAMKPSPDGTTFNYIKAQIQTPHTDYLRQGFDQSVPQRAASWIGFGAMASPHNGILQTGCSIFNDGNGNLTSRCWYEFYPAHPVFFDDQGFHPSVGDTILLELNRTSDTTGCAKLTNLNTHAMVSANIVAPSGYGVTGEDAEWIVENNDGPNFVNFHSQRFEESVAETANGNSYGPGQGTYTIFNEWKDINDGTGKHQWTKSYVPSDSVVQVDFIAPYQ